MKRIFVSAVLSLNLMSPVALPVMAVPTYQVISRDAAMQSAVEVQAEPGRSTAGVLQSFWQTEAGAKTLEVLPKP
ncbi:MAG: hypothetical protein KME42_24165 [Tildeniella nuda ZEHNDER 1965/U140]|jgi:hypothetical protein|nr:hypothetical protein [Tildeniella nuda ZEHNDER 1965/U140]